MMKFSQRIGKTPATKEIQLENIDDDLKNGLWNMIKLFYLDKLKKSRQEFKDFATALWYGFYKLPVDTVPSNNRQIENYIRTFFFEGEWYEIYNLIEFLLRIGFNQRNKRDLILGINSHLKLEFSGYRIIDGKIAPIANDLEIEAMSEAISNTKQFTALEGANIHLKKALDLISDKKSPQYRNSIKESISAVEATCRIITGENTLGKALNKLEKNGLSINKQLQSGIEKIYAYTNNKENGIRHAIIETPIEPDFHDAKYMLISCSTFINYLIGKASQLGMQLE